MRLYPLLALTSLTVLMTACSITGNVAALSHGQRVMHGTYTATLTGAYYTLTNGRVTCTGAFNTNVNQDPAKVPMLCTDGRKGTAVITRQLNGYDGYGTLTFTDGEQIDIVFGRLAQPFLPKPCSPQHT